MFRKSTIQDCAAVYELICGLEGKELPFDRFSEIYSKQVNDKRYYCLACEHEGRVTGILNLRFEEQLHHSECIAEIMEFVIAPDYRNRGTGREMFSEACRVARELGCAQLEVACNQLRESTHRFYLREGMHNFHYKFSMRLTGEDMPENEMGR